MAWLFRPVSASASLDAALVTPFPSVRVLWRPEQFTRITNGGFETNTTGWSASSGINAAATSITRITTDAHGGSACASVVCTATDGSGVNWDFGSDTFRQEPAYGAIHVATGWIKRVSGSTSAKVILGSEGTSTDRATLEVTLTEAWQPFAVRWLPTSSRTDVQLAVTNGSAEAVTFLLDDVAVHLTDCFSQVENGDFETTTNGWVVTAGTFAAAATSITRTLGGFGGDYCGRVVTSAADAASGTTFDLGTRRFTSGRTYRLRLGARTVSGNAEVKFQLGTSGDSASSTVTLTGSFEWYTVDWTPSADRDDVEIAAMNTTAATRTFDIDEVEVYEAIDDLGSDVSALRWSRVPGQVGSIAVEVANATGKYDPRNASGDLYGLLMPGRPLWGRATYGNVLYPLFHGTIRTIEGRAWEAKADLLADDSWAELTRADVSTWMDPEQTFTDARAVAVAAVVARDPDIGASTVGGSRLALATGGIEASTFFDITDGEESAGGYLAELDDATQSVAWCAPTVHANMPWRYTTVDRATLTDTSSDFTVDEDFEAFEGVRVTDEALENRQAIPWQAYDVLPPPRAAAIGGGSGIIAMAEDPTTYPDTEYASYLTFTDDDFGTDDDHPEPRWRYPRGWSRSKWLRRRRKGHRVPRRTRILPDAVVPASLDDGETRTYTIETTIPMHDMYATVEASGGGGATASVTSYSQDRFRFTFTILADGDVTILGIYVWGTPWLQSDDSEAVVDDLDSQAILGVYPGGSLSTPYIPSLGAAQGVGAYRNWRYARPRMRPTLVDHDNFPRTLTADVADHFTVSADRWHVDGALFVSTGCRWEVTSGGLEWRSWHDLEELPAHSDWFVLDSSVLDGSDVLAY